jgi:hypothetical protein
MIYAILKINADNEFIYMFLLGAWVRIGIGVKKNRGWKS